jgi:hypothetical protein
MYNNSANENPEKDLHQCIGESIYVGRKDRKV